MAAHCALVARCAGGGCDAGVQRVAVGREARGPRDVPRGAPGEPRLAPRPREVKRSRGGGGRQKSRAGSARCSAWNGAAERGPTPPSGRGPGALSTLRHLAARAAQPRVQLPSGSARTPGGAHLTAAPAWRPTSVPPRGHEDVHTALRPVTAGRSATARAAAPTSHIRRVGFV